MTQRSDNWQDWRGRSVPAYPGSRGGKRRELVDWITKTPNGALITADNPVLAGTCIWVGPVPKGCIVLDVVVWAASGGAVDVGGDGDDKRFIDAGTASTGARLNNFEDGFAHIMDAECVTVKFAGDLTGPAKIIFSYVTD